MGNGAQEPPTIYEWGGGHEAFARWLDVFYDLVERDELLSTMFGGRVTDAHRRSATAWWCEVMGGPDEYTRTEGGYEQMLGKHLGLAITPEQRLRFVTLLEPGRRRRGPPRRPRVPRGGDRLRRVGLAPRAGQLAAGRGRRRARSRAALGLGRRAAVRAVARARHRDRATAIALTASV